MLTGDGDEATVVPTAAATPPAPGDDANRSNLDRLLETAVQHCPTAEVLWYVPRECVRD